MLFRRVGLALAAVVVAGYLLCVPPSSVSADPGSSSTLVLAGQSATVTPSAPGSPAPYTVSVRVEGGAPAGTEVGLTFYDRLNSRSEFEQTLTGTPSGVMQHVAPVPLRGPAAAGASMPLTVTIVAGMAEPSGSSSVGLTRCAVGDGSCSGVYPVAVQLLASDGTTTLSHFTTYLTYAETRSLRPLVFSWVAPIGTPVRVRTTGPISTAIAPLSATRVADLEQLVSILAQNPGVSETVAPSPAAIESLEANHSFRARVTLQALRAFATASPHRLLSQPYVPVNLASLSEAGVTTEITGQTQRATQVMASLLGGLPPADQPAKGTWVAQGPVSPSIAVGMRDVGADHLVLPDTAVPSATELAHATWAQPFELTVGRGTVIAATSDSQLSSYFTADAHDPVLAANQLLADLAMIHFELPGAPSPRGVIAVPPSEWDPNPQFVAALVGGLVANPVVTTATLDQFFASVPVGGNDAVGTRRLLVASSAGDINASEAAAIAAARKQITGFTEAVSGHPSVENQLEDLLLASESSELKPGAQRAGIASFERHLATELGAISVIASTVTLTARTASIPITIISSAGYKLTATLTLSSAKLQFPQGATRTVSIDHPTNLTSVEVRARTTGDLPLSFTLTSPGGNLVIAHGRLTVRSTATSIVGIVLTLVAAVVLFGWWARTWRRGRRDRRARSARGGE